MPTKTIWPSTLTTWEVEGNFRIEIALHESSLLHIPNTDFALTHTDDHAGTIVVETRLGDTAQIGQSFPDGCISILCRQRVRPGRKKDQTGEDEDVSRVQRHGNVRACCEPNVDPL
jgi:hypothetical protein